MATVMKCSIKYKSISGLNGPAADTRGVEKYSVSLDGVSLTESILNLVIYNPETFCFQPIKGDWKAGKIFFPKTARIGLQL